MPSHDYAAFALATFRNLLETLDRLATMAVEAALPTETLAACLTEDMFPLELQFRVAISQVLLAFGQVGRRDVPLDATAYASFREIRDAIARAQALVAAADPISWLSAEEPVDLTLPNGVRFVMSAEEDIRDWILPNFYFHVTMGYALLRSAGLPLGKMDFLPFMATHRQDERTQ